MSEFWQGFFVGLGVANLLFILISQMGMHTAIWMMKKKDIKLLSQQGYVDFRDEVHKPQVTGKDCLIKTCHGDIFLAQFDEGGRFCNKIAYKSDGKIVGWKYL